ncbi:sigma factor-like helix-turn-helix DNA-binding protein [Streptomyces sp. NPDC001292]|uniref:sigma factor-like helix-turn-helix DNA-binding protein n=1 Tax=Streptomyces sp. NPDC001292 TaxID=3364558 RepID=UPI0036B51576
MWRSCCLSEREADVMRRRCGLVGGERQTLGEIGEEYGVTRERTRQLENRARDRLKKVLAGSAPAPRGKRGRKRKTQVQEEASPAPAPAPAPAPHRTEGCSPGGERQEAACAGRAGDSVLTAQRSGRIMARPFRRRRTRLGRGELGMRRLRWANVCSTHQ